MKTATWYVTLAVVFPGMVGMVGVACSDGAGPVMTPEAEVGDVEPDGGDVGPDAVDGDDAVETEVDDTSGPSEVGDTRDDVGAPDTHEVVTATCPESACEPGEICDDGVCVCDPAPVSYRADIAPKLATGCGPGCHVYNGSVNSGSAGLNLALAFSHQELVEVPTFQCGDDRVRVAMGDVGGSYLMDKMLGRRMCAGGRMPKGRALWSQPDLALLGRWICQGARND